MKVLMICTGNTCRSPMAEGIVRDMLQKAGIRGIEVASMGLGANDGELPTANAVEAMREIGVDITGKRARRLMMEDLAQTDRFYVMTQSHKDILIDAMPELEDRIRVLDIADPYGCRLEVYRECRDAMLRYFQNELADLAAHGEA